jgi:hypothetical protein
MDIPRTLEQDLKRSMEGLLNAEKGNKLSGGRSTIVLFIPKDEINLNNNDLTIAKEQLKYFRDYLPGLYVKMSLLKLTITMCQLTLLQPDYHNMPTDTTAT